MGSNLLPCQSQNRYSPPSMRQKGHLFCALRKLLKLECSSAKHKSLLLENLQKLYKTTFKTLCQMIHSSQICASTLFNVRVRCLVSASLSSISFNSSKSFISGPKSSALSSSSNICCKISSAFFVFRFFSL